MILNLLKHGICQLGLFGGPTNGNDWTFIGHFDGRGYLISNIQITTSLASTTTTYNYVGLFGVVHGMVRNLGVQGAINIGSGAGRSRVGLLAACNEAGSASRTGLIESCYAIVDVSYFGVHFTDNMQDVGLLVGYNVTGAKIINCYAVGTVTTNTVSNVTTSNINTGGLVGRNATSASITNCYADVVVEANHSGCSRGALVGNNPSGSGNVVNSYAGTGGVDGFGTGVTPSPAIKPIADLNASLDDLPSIPCTSDGVNGFYPFW